MEKKRKCRYCGKTRPIEKFEIANIIKGKEYRRWKCSSCYHETKSVRRRKIKQWLDNLKETLKCSKCGIRDFRVIDFHHKGDDKEICIGQAMQRWSQGRIEKEIAKCIAICSKCHRILHWKDRNGV